MTKFKKLVLSLSILFTLAIAGVIGIVGNSSHNANNDVNSTPSATEVNIDSVAEKLSPKLHYEPGEVMFQRGTNYIDYMYNPSVNSTWNTANTIAYEYVFGNTMDREAAVNLKSIMDTTSAGVTIQYAWSTSEITDKDSFEAKDAYEIQILDAKGSASGKDTLYVYIILSPKDSASNIDFTSSVKWYYGVPYNMPIIDNTGRQTTQTIVDGQRIDKNTLPIPTAPENQSANYPWYFDGWFLDPEFTQMVGDEEVQPGRTLYPRWANLPKDYLVYSGVVGWNVDQDTFFISENIDIVIPTTHTVVENYAGAEVVVSDYVMNTGSKGNYGTSAFQNAKSVSLPSTITTIPAYSFYGGNCEVVNIPAGLKEIGDYAFAFNTATKNVDLSKCSGVTFGGGVFENAGLQNIVLPNDMSVIPGNMFNLSTLPSITLPDSITTIGYNAFSYSSLTSITIPKNVTSIGDSAFAYCGSLTSVTLPDSITTIGAGAFQYCSLTSITIPKNVTSIGENAFYGCNSLTSVTLANTGFVTIGERAFGSTGSVTLTLTTDWGCMNNASSMVFDNVREIWNYSSFYLHLGSADYGGIALFLSPEKLHQPQFD